VGYGRNKSKQARVNSSTPELLTYSGLNKANINIKDMQCTYNVALRRVRVTTFAVEKQCVLNPLALELDIYSSAHHLRKM
jgi:hypothetical protein